VAERGAAERGFEAEDDVGVDGEGGGDGAVGGDVEGGLSPEVGSPAKVAVMMCWAGEVMVAWLSIPVVMAAPAGTPSIVNTTLAPLRVVPLARGVANAKLGTRP
jgi:hypothetical protein